MQTNKPMPEPLRVILGDVFAQAAVRRAKEKAADNLQETSGPKSDPRNEERTK